MRHGLGSGAGPPLALQISLGAKVYLQGALYGVSAPGVLMRDDLRAKGYLPLTH